MFVARLSDDVHLFSDGKLNTDNRPYVEFSAPKSTFHYTPDENQRTLLENYSPMPDFLLDGLSDEQKKIVRDSHEAMRLTLEANIFRAKDDYKNNIANRVNVVRDGVEAIDFLFCRGTYEGRDASEQPALVLMDLKLPKLDGLQVLQLMREDPRTEVIPVVVLTTSNEDEDIVNSYRLGANSYIRKPVDFTRFLEAVGQLGAYWLLLNEVPPSMSQ